MVLEEIEVKNFRNFENTIFTPGKKVNYIIGKNAQGKTNLIEAIYYQSIGKSFRTNHIKNLMNNKNDIFIRSVLTHNQVKYSLHIKANTNFKNILLNNKVVKIKDISKILKVILYYPSEINLLLKSPAHRRNLIDKSIFLHDSDYLDLHIDYLKCLKNRNLCLKQKKDSYIWTEKLISFSYDIVVRRIKYIDKINTIIFDNGEVFQNENYKIKYKILDLLNYKDKLKNELNNAKEKELKLGYTTYGQHTDSIEFHINNNNIDDYGSEGQKKTFLLLYKISQLSNFYNQEMYKPILILDDIKSETDSEREKILLEMLLSNCDQSFLTTLSRPAVYNKNYKYFNIDNGKLLESKGNK